MEKSQLVIHSLPTWIYGILWISILFFSCAVEVVAKLIDVARSETSKEGTASLGWIIISRAAFFMSLGAAVTVAAGTNMQPIILDFVLGGVCMNGFLTTIRTVEDVKDLIDIISHLRSQKESYQHLLEERQEAHIQVLNRCLGLQKVLTSIHKPNLFS